MRGDALRGAHALRTSERPGGSREWVVVGRDTPRPQSSHPGRAVVMAPLTLACTASRPPADTRTAATRAGGEARASARAFPGVGNEEQERKLRTYPSACGPPVASMGFTAAAVLCAAPVAAAVVVATVDTSGNCWRKLASRSSPGFRVLVLSNARVSAVPPSPGEQGRPESVRRVFVGARACDLGGLGGGAP